MNLESYRTRRKHLSRRYWDKLGDMEPHEAMKRYLEVLDSVLPLWNEKSEYPVAPQVHAH